MEEYETRVTQLTVVPDGEPIFSEMAYVVEIEDEAGGEYVTVESQADAYGKIAIAPQEWPALRAAIEKMLMSCRDGEPCKQKI